MLSLAEHSGGQSNILENKLFFVLNGSLIEAERRLKIGDPCVRLGRRI
jgi:hypothetical protein